MFKKKYIKTSHARLSLKAFFSGVLLCTLLLSACGQAPAASPSTTSPATSQKPASTAPPREWRRQLSFTQLMEQNADTVGWIEVPGTVIDYLVLQARDNDYYLTHNEKKEEDRYGAIYADAANSSLLTDPVTLIYGHYTPEETHFSQLHKYKDRAFFDANQSIFLYNYEKQREYQVIAGFTKDDQSILYGKDYTEAAEMEGFISWMKSHEGQDDTQLALDGVTANDTFLVLLTCTGAHEADPYRYVVVAKLVDEID